METLTNSFHW